MENFAGDLTEALRRSRRARVIVELMKTLLVISLLLAACHTPAGPTSPTTSDLAQRRAQMLAWLHDYSEAGKFPQDAQGHPLSVFRDARGVRCPMAELIYRSGHQDLVDQVARTHNDLRLADVHGGPLYAWIVESGLTQQEVAMIQGAMTPQEMRMMERQPPQLANAVGGLNEKNVIVLNADAVKRANEWGQVRGHLSTAEVALKNATPASLAAAQRLLAPRTRPASTQILETMR